MDKFLTTQASANPALAASYETMLKLYNKKLWHQLTGELETFVVRPEAQKASVLVPLYDTFIKTFETKLSQLKLAQIALVVTRYRGSQADQKAFIDAVAETVKHNKEASLLCQVEVARLWLGVDDVKCRATIEAAGNELSKMTGVDNSIHSNYFFVLSQLHKAKGQLVDFYKAGLMYLGYTQLDTVPKSEQAVLAFDLGLAALVGESIYNFYELLSHPVIESLAGTPYAWMKDLLQAFNGGDAALYAKVMAANKVDIEKQKVLKDNKAVLKNKFALSCLIELVFHRPAEDRRIPFVAIAEATKLPVNDVEILVIEALSAGLLRGKIDQVDQVVQVTWCQPRVLSTDRIKVLQKRLSSWTDGVMQTTRFIESEVPELLA